MHTPVDTTPSKPAWRRAGAFALAACAFLIGQPRAHAEVRLPAIFGDHMVLQRDATIPVWGWADAGEAVQVALGETRAATTAAADGTWRVDLPKTAAKSDAQVLTVTGTNTLSYQDVLVGEVWICSGQSNMDWRVGAAGNAKEEVAAAEYTRLRMFRMARTPALAPQADCKGEWIVCSPATASNFTAVGYYFGRELMQRLDLPVGLIDASWGGTRAEPWTSLEGLKALPSFAEDAIGYEYARDVGTADRAALGAAYAAATAARPAKRAAWYADMDARDPGILGAWMAPEHDASGWWPLALPVTKDANPMGFFVGTVWCRKEVQIPPTWVGQDLTLNLGIIDEVDETWVNGVKIGRTWLETPEFWKVSRSYTVPASAVTSTTVSVTVRVLNQYFELGLFGPAEAMCLELKVPDGDDDADAGEVDGGDGFGGAEVALDGAWRYRDGLAIEHREIPQLPRKMPPTAKNSELSNLYNGMIRPLIPYGIRGAIWYQGESNASPKDYFEYRELFGGLIRSWRAAWGQGDFPFAFVQLANYMKPQELPVEKGSWAELREAQALTLTDIPATSMATIIDIGEAGNIHPKNKQDVGLRLALPILAKTFGQELEYSGPTYSSLTVEGAKARVHFTHAEGLTGKAESLPSFAIAGADRVFHHAQATVDGETVLVWSPAVPEPVAVRYGWANNPRCELYNAAGLPATPFRTDGWAAFEVQPGE